MGSMKISQFVRASELQMSIKLVVGVNDVNGCGMRAATSCCIILRASTCCPAAWQCLFGSAASSRQTPRKGHHHTVRHCFTHMSS